MVSQLLLLAALSIGATGLLGPDPVRAAVPAAVTPAAVTLAAITPAAVTIDNFSFTPATLTVLLGTEVTWTNHDDIPHTIVMPDPGQALKSPALDTDDHFSFTFGRAGTYRYFCSLHPHMQGTVIVQ